MSAAGRCRARAWTPSPQDARSTELLLPTKCRSDRASAADDSPRPMTTSVSSPAAEPSAGRISGDCTTLRTLCSSSRPAGVAHHALDAEHVVAAGMQQRRQPDAEGGPVDVVVERQRVGEDRRAFAVAPKIGQGRGIAGRKVGQRHRCPAPPPRSAAAGIERSAASRSSAGKRDVVGRIDLGDDQPVGGLDLAPAERLLRSCASPCSASTATTISPTTIWWTSTGSARIAATIGAGIGEAAGLEHDPVNRGVGRPRYGCARRRCRAARATSSARGRCSRRSRRRAPRRPRRAAEQRIVDRRLGGLVDEDAARRQKPPAWSWWRSQVVLPEPRKPPSIVSRMPAVGAAVQPRPRRLPPVKRGSSGSTGRPHSRSAAIHTSSRSRTMRLAAGQGADLDARHESRRHAR